MFSPFLHAVGTTDLAYQYRLKPTRAQGRALGAVLDEQRRFHNRLLEDLRGLWKSYAALRDKTKADPSLQPIADVRLAEMRVETSQFGMQRTYTLLREAYPVRYGALPANVWRGTIKRLALSQKAFLKRAHEGAGPPRFKSESRFRTFSFLETGGLTINLVGARETLVASRARNFSCLLTREPDPIANDPVAVKDRQAVNAGGRNASKSRTSRKRSGHQVATLAFRGVPGKLGVDMHRPLPDGADVLDATFTRKGERWYVTFKVEAANGVLNDEWKANLDVKEARKPAEARTVRSDVPVGVDWGVATLFTLSDGTEVANPRLFRAVRERITDLSQALARCKRGSKRRAKARKELRRCWQRLADMRLTFAHQVTADMVARHARLAFEDLDVKSMTGSAKGTVEKPGKDVKRKAGLNREILDVAPGRLMDLMRYKAGRAGGEARFVDARGTSLTCHACGTVAPKTLDEREHRCRCGARLSRDLNAALVIRDRAYPPEPTELRQAA